MPGGGFVIPTETKRELACLRCTPETCGKLQECGCECHVPVTDDVAGVAVSAPLPSAEDLIDVGVRYLRRRAEVELKTSTPEELDAWAAANPSVSVEMWQGKPHIRRRCPPGDQCFACDRLGSHLEPLLAESESTPAVTLDVPPEVRRFIEEETLRRPFPIAEMERGPANTPVEIKTRKELREKFGSLHGRGSIGAIEESVHILLEEEAPVGVTVRMIKGELARYWLGRPRGILARLRWAAKLLFEP